MIRCMVSVGNHLAQSTDVTWMVNDQPLENSYLEDVHFRQIRGNLDACIDPSENCV